MDGSPPASASTSPPAYAGGRLVQSRHLQHLVLPSGSVLLAHGLRGTRMVVRAEVAKVVEAFARARRVEPWVRRFARDTGSAVATVWGVLDGLVERGFLVSPDVDEDEALAKRLSALFDRDPTRATRALNAATNEGAHEYWSAPVPRGLEDLAALQHRVDVVALGACDVQMQLDVLRHLARSEGVDLRAVATFATDFAILAERAHDFVLLGMLDERYAMMSSTEASPERIYLDAVEATLTRIRGVSRAPVLVSNLPLPTVTPLGLADRGPSSHRNRVRAVNLGLAELAERFDAVFVVDVDAALARAGSARLLDDGLQAFAHFGALRWLEQRPETERAAVYDVFPDLAQLDALGTAGTYELDHVLATEQLDVILAVKRIRQQKCIAVDLDNTLWPGVLAETGAPFAWSPVVSGAFSFVGVYFGLHEALRALARRGVLLACVSKNDEDVVRRLWHYGPEYPKDRLLGLDDFVSLKINWREKVDNLRELSEELQVGLDAFVFVDDNPVEREKVRRYLPQVEVLGDNPFTLRRRLLTSPRLQTVTITPEAATRTVAVRAQVARERARKESLDPRDFLRSLELDCDVFRVHDGADLARVHELVLRTNQFNTTGIRYAAEELAQIAQLPHTTGGVFGVRAKDRFVDYGLVGACVVRDRSFELVVLSCRVLGLGVEHALLGTVLAQLGGEGPVLGRLVRTDRNQPARNVFRDVGFDETSEGAFRLASAASVRPIPDHIAIRTAQTTIVS